MRFPGKRKSKHYFPVAERAPATLRDDVQSAYAKAVAAGAASLKAPLVKPWGQTVAYVRCPDGTLVEICSPVVG